MPGLVPIYSVLCVPLTSAPFHYKSARFAQCSVSFRHPLCAAALTQHLPITCSCTNEWNRNGNRGDTQPSALTPTGKAVTPLPLCPPCTEASGSVYTRFQSPFTHLCDREQVTSLSFLTYKWVKGENAHMEKFSMGKYMKCIS